MAERFQLWVCLALLCVFGFGFFVGSTIACQSLTEALKLSGHGDLQPLVKELMVCR